MKHYFSLLLVLSSSLYATTYEEAGVSISTGNRFVDTIKPLIKQTKRPGSDCSIGGFGGMFDISSLGYQDPLLVSGTDGVGTKLKLAHLARKHDTIGIDLVAMCVNDILAQGAEPLFFLDYFATSTLDIDQAAQVVKGITTGCKQSHCALIGGETAEMPGMYYPNEYDVAGFAVGIVERSQVLPKKESMVPGDILIGLSSSGVHSNGFSLVRHLIKERSINAFAKAPFKTSHATLLEELLTPTKIYVEEVLPLIKQNLIKGIAHITGGGLTENIPRMLPDHLDFTLDYSSWERPEIFRWIASLGVSEEELLRTFNCGIGMVLVVDEKDIILVLNHLNKEKETATIIGMLKDK